MPNTKKQEELNKKKLLFLERAAKAISTRQADDPPWVAGVQYSANDVIDKLRKLGLRYRPDQEENILEALVEYMAKETRKYHWTPELVPPAPCLVARETGCAGIVIRRKGHVPVCSMGGFPHYLAGRLRLNNVVAWLDKVEAIRRSHE